MENLDVNNLEDSLNAASGKPAPSEESKVPQMSPDEEIGFHKGAVNTLMAERNELVKMIGNVETIAQAHVKRLGELGVDLNKKE